MLSILWKYGSFIERETVFDELYIVKTPSYVYFKGKGFLFMESEKPIDIVSFKNGLGISSADLIKINRITVNCNKIVTIENLTSFYTYNKDDSFCIYLGGYHNEARRTLLKAIFNCNKDKEYLHYGDIDAGGFMILKHLIEKTGIDFKTLNMDVATLNQYHKYWRPLSENDKFRLKKLLNSEYIEPVKFMLENNCKLEQETLNQI